MLKTVKPIKPVESKCLKCQNSSFQDENDFNYHVLVCYGKQLIENNEIEFRYVISCQAIVRQLSGSCQAVVRQLSGSCQGLTKACMPSLLGRSQILIGCSSDSILQTVVHTVRELQL